MYTRYNITPDHDAENKSAGRARKHSRLRVTHSVSSTFDETGPTRLLRLLLNFFAPVLDILAYASHRVTSGRQDGNSQQHR